MVLNLIAETSKAKKVLPVKILKKSKKKGGRSIKKQIRNEVQKQLTKRAEKKEQGYYVGDTSVGQIVCSSTGLISSGHYSASIVPTPSNGTSDNQRIGDTITITGMYQEFQFRHQSNTSSPIKGKIIFAVPKWTGVSGTGFTNLGMTELLNPNPFIQGYNSGVALVQDYMSSRNQDYMANWKVIRTFRFNVPGEQSVASQKIVKTFKVGLKFKKGHKLQFNDAGNIVEGDIRMFIVLDSGNASAYAPSGGAGGIATGIAVTDALTGLTLSWFSKAYYIDS